jgi:hypothetical protein
MRSIPWHLHYAGQTRFGVAQHRRLPERAARR